VFGDPAFDNDANSSLLKLFDRTDNDLPVAVLPEKA